MKKTKVYRECKDGKSGDVLSTINEFHFEYKNKRLPAEIFPSDGVLPTPYGFCALCWRPTEKLEVEMNFKVAKLDGGRKKESPIFGKYSPEISSPTASVSYLFEEENIDEATYVSMLHQSHFIMKKLTHAFQVATENPTCNNSSEFEELLLKYAPGYIPTVVSSPDKLHIDFERLRWSVLQNLSLSNQLQDKLPLLSHTRRPSSTFCAEHNQASGPTQRRRYQRDIKYEDMFNKKIISILEKQGLVRKKSLQIGAWEMREIFRMTRLQMEQVRKEAYVNLDRRINSTPELIIKMFADGKRQCEILKELVERGLLNTNTGRQVVSNALRREKKKQDTIDEIKKQRSQGVPESEIAIKLRISSHTVTRLLEA